MTNQNFFPALEDDPEDLFPSGQMHMLAPIIRGQLRGFPEICHSVRSANAKFIGAAGEFLVDSVLTRHGLRVWTAPDLHCADRLLDLSGHALLLQIKTITAPTDGVCSFSMQRGNGRTGGQRPYSANAFDIAALVILSHNAVKFMPNFGRSFRILESELPALIADPIESLEVSISTVLRKKKRYYC
ncbi:hypothetical protein [Tabrizicola sp. TH137]|uniref:hypothetical protein n=1 Tax=Tabrizicola sp. TH137 TaxID=2067452 RepID=UPI00117D90FB|nr:hypothetical protein [Tabrizicola sp. TH137]